MAKPEEIKLLDLNYIKYKNTKEYLIICLHKDDEKAGALVDGHGGPAIPPFEANLFIQFTKLNSIEDMTHSEIIDFIRRKMPIAWGNRSYKTFFLKEIVVVRNYGQIKQTTSK